MWQSKEQGISKTICYEEYSELFKDAWQRSHVTLEWDGEMGIGYARLLSKYW